MMSKNPEPFAFASEYCLAQMANRTNYCLSLMWKSEKEYVNPVYSASAVDAITKECDAWKRIALGAGVCQTCAMGAPDTFGCSDCLNTGWDGGKPVGFVSDDTVTAITRRSELLLVALTEIIERSQNGELGTSKVMDMRKIAQAAIKEKDND